MKTLIFFLAFFAFNTFADHKETVKDSLTTERPTNDMPAELNLTKEQLKDEFLDACKMECPEIKHVSSCSVHIKGIGKVERKGEDNRCLAFKAICKAIKEKKLDPKKATEHSCTHP